MSASFNKVLLVGNLTRDPELRYIPSGTAVTDIGLAVNDRRKNAKGEWIEEATFVDVTLWGRTAEVASEYLTKGSHVLIEGRLKFDSWETPDGQKRSKLRVVGETMKMLGSKGGGGGGGGGARSQGGGGKAPANFDDGDYGPPPDVDDGPPQRGGGARPPDDDIPF